MGTYTTLGCMYAQCHAYIWKSPLACTAVQYYQSAQHPCPLLAPAAPSLGGGTRPGGYSGEFEPAYVPAAMALLYPHTAVMHIFMNAH